VLTILPFFDRVQLSHFAPTRFSSRPPRCPSTCALKIEKASKCWFAVSSLLLLCAGVLRLAAVQTRLPDSCHHLALTRIQRTAGEQTPKPYLYAVFRAVGKLEVSVSVANCFMFPYKQTDCKRRSRPGDTHWRWPSHPQPGWRIFTSLTWSEHWGS
jgi:hypothetical protein